MAQSLILPPGQRALVTTVVMVGALMVVLDTTIANVALPHMQAALGANTESVAWVLTSYIVASAIAIPLTGWLSDKFGRRRLFTLALFGFTFSSVLCGLARSLEMMVFARLLQGVCGAFLLPLSQAIIYDINPPERHARAMTIWGAVIMIGPIMGPLVGGWLTEALDWRWVFFVNLPLGALAVVFAWLSLPKHRGVPPPFDFRGYVLLASALASFQLMLDRGTLLDWFESTEIIIEAGIAVAALWMFIVHTATTRHPILSAALFRDRNLMSGLVLATLVGALVVVGAVMLSPLLQRLMGYPVLEAGMIVAPRGVGTMIGMLAASRMIKTVDPRILMVAGLLISAWSLHMMTGFNLEMGSGPLLISGFIQGAGFGLTMLPVNLLAFETLRPALRTEAASLLNLLRNIGGAIAITVATALLTRNHQTSHADLGTHVTTVTAPFLTGATQQYGLVPALPAAMIDAEINRQALMIAYLDDFWLMMWACLLVCPVVLLMRPNAKGEKGESPQLVME